jgi:hypothetical protein
MSLMTKEIVVPVADLQFMTVQCSFCETAVVLDMKKPLGASNKALLLKPPINADQRR